MHVPAWLLESFHLGKSLFDLLGALLLVLQAEGQLFDLFLQACVLRVELVNEFDHVDLGIVTFIHAFE